MASKSVREERRARRKKQQTTKTIIWSVIGIIVVAIIGFLAWTAFRPAVGESVPIMANAGEHVPEGADPGPFNSDPPTSGKHYGNEYEAGFYEETDPEVQADFPEGYLIHNLEHGYTIFWYNCNLVDQASCTNLKDEIKDVMNEVNNFKVIGFPRSSIEVPLVLTSWGQMLPMESLDSEQALDFINRNRNKAPEPNAP
jgi:hypothetical protein